KTPESPRISSVTPARVTAGGFLMLREAGSAGLCIRGLARSHRTRGGPENRTRTDGARRAKGSRRPRPKRRAHRRPGRTVAPDLRHSCAHLLLDAGVDLSLVQRILRHKDPKLTVETYGHLRAEWALRKIEAVSRSRSPSRRKPPRPL